VYYVLNNDNCVVIIYVTYNLVHLEYFLIVSERWLMCFWVWNFSHSALVHALLSVGLPVCRDKEFSYKEGAFASTSRPSRMRENHRPKFDVLLTSYEFVSFDSATLSSIDWEVLIIDEAHRLKNNQSLVSMTFGSSAFLGYCR